MSTQKERAEQIAAKLREVADHLVLNHYGPRTVVPIREAADLLSSLPPVRAEEPTDLMFILERVNVVHRAIAERRSIAGQMRGRAIGASHDVAMSSLRTAEQCENLAEGMERALSMLGFGR